MADEREHIERHGITVELVEICGDGNLRAAILSYRHSCDALRNLRRCGRVLVQATIGMVVRINESRRYYQAVRIDHPGTVGNLDLRALSDGVNGISFDNNNSVFDGRTPGAINQRCTNDRHSLLQQRAADPGGRRSLITGKGGKNHHQSSSDYHDSES